MEIKDGNRVIAEFMGRSFPLSHIDDYKGHELPYYVVTRIRYDREWRLLMPVVEKINQIKGFDIIIYKTTVHVNDEREILIETTSQKIIEAVWNAVAQFIQYHNQNNPHD